MSNNILSQFPEENNDYRRGIGYYLPLIIMAVIFIIGFAFIGYFTMNLIDDMLAEPETFGEPIVIIEEEIPKEVIEEPVVEIVEEVEEEEPEVYVHMTDDDILAAVAMSESGNQFLLGKCVVVATVLNRADYYDMTVEQVVNAPNQYSYPYYGIVTEECYEAVEIVRKNRKLFEGVMWFRTGNYHDIGMPWGQLQDHYFSYLPIESED